MAASKKSAKKGSTKGSRKRRGEAPRSSADSGKGGDLSGPAEAPADAAADGTPEQPVPTAASEILDAVAEVEARREAARRAFAEQRAAIMRSLEEQRRSAMDYLSHFRHSLETDEENMVHVATEQAKAALDALLPPSVRAATAGARSPADQAGPDSAAGDSPARDTGAASDDRRLLAALRLLILDASRTGALSTADREIAERALLDALKALARVAVAGPRDED